MNKCLCRIARLRLLGFIWQPTNTKHLQSSTPALATDSKPGIRNILQLGDFVSWFLEHVHLGEKIFPDYPLLWWVVKPVACWKQVHTDLWKFSHTSHTSSMTDHREFAFPHKREDRWWIALYVVEKKIASEAGKPRETDDTQHSNCAFSHTNFEDEHHPSLRKNMANSDLLGSWSRMAVAPSGFGCTILLRYPKS